MKQGYVLEVLRYNIDLDTEEEILRGGNIEHIGYMKKIFKTKTAAIYFYNLHNKHMRNINQHNTLISDWDPETKLLYAIRTYINGLYLNISTFNN